tara:strand:+ start:195 stop:497 length:303 start_codon:yes stop_codon:yes gene_type:complete
MENAGNICCAKHSSEQFVDHGKKRSTQKTKFKQSSHVSSFSTRGVSIGITDAKFRIPLLKRLIFTSRGEFRMLTGQTSPLRKQKMNKVYLISTKYILNEY